MNLIIENIRTFKGLHRVPIRPLTILTGENSSGKTTLLAALSAVSEGGGIPLAPEFNAQPYGIGTYDNIASSDSSSRRVDNFSLGWADGEGGEATEAIGTYRSNEGVATLVRFSLVQGSFGLVIEFDAAREVYDLRFSTENGRVDLQAPVPENVRPGLSPRGGISLVQEMVSRAFVSQVQTKNERDLGPALRDAVAEAFKLAYRISTLRQPAAATSIAPIRTRSERTYDPEPEYFSPESRHVPYVLAKLFREGEQHEQRQLLLDALNSFGTDSGLFEAITVRELGCKGADPFQVLVTISGEPRMNLSDVGYGVSQSLPVVVEGVLTGEGTRLLIQQPEVHLHPRAQAALGSFFVKLVAGQQKELVVETHSDYIVDRVRQEVAARTIPAESVVILYFHRTGLETKIYPIELDELGNLVNVPPMYRDFFLAEHSNLLSMAR